jgi:hypothetical protein
MTKYLAIRCQLCKSVIISRARHDWNCCKCYDNGTAATETEPMVESTGCYIDGDSNVDSGGYVRLGGRHFDQFYVELPFSATEVYVDYAKQIDKLMFIDIKKYPLIDIP